MNCSKFTDFGLCVKTELLRTGKEQKWLEEAVSEKTGLFVDNGYLYKIFTGRRNAPKIVDAICEIGRTFRASFVWYFVVLAPVYVRYQLGYRR